MKMKALTALHATLATQPRIPEDVDPRETAVESQIPKISIKHRVKDGNLLYCSHELK